MLKINASRVPSTLALSAALAFGPFAIRTDAAVVTKKSATTKPKRTTKRTKPMPVTTTRKQPTQTTTTKVTTTTVSPTAQVRAGYEAYLAAFVAAAREPEKAMTLLPTGMTGDALTRMLEIRRLDAADGVYWDGDRSSIVSGPTIENVGDTTATLRDCRSVGGVLRQKGTGAVVPGTTEPDVDDLRVTLVRIDGRWLVTSTERFNDVEGRSRCKPGAPPSH